LITNNAIYFEGLLKAHLAVKNASINILDWNNISHLPVLALE
jgi:hypothetical protein